ncbi:hypothetical protein ES703_10300 [subsurface metagenome]
MPDSCPKAFCLLCGKYYSGWSLAQRKNCDCGGKLIVNFPYNVIIAHVKAGDKGRR